MEAEDSSVSEELADGGVLGGAIGSGGSSSGMDVEGEGVVGSASTAGQVAGMKAASLDPDAGGESQDSRAALGIIAGLVIDGQGQPIAGAGVQARGKYGEGSATSTEKGAFEVSILGAAGSPPGEEENLCMVFASKPGLGSASALRVPLGESALELVIWGNATIQGMVVDADTGEPVQAFDARITRARSPVEGMMGTAADWTPFRDSGGWFTLESPNDIGEIEVRAQGHETQTVDILVQTGELVDDLVVELVRGYSIAGIVVDARTGAPVPGTSIGITHGEIRQWWDVTDANMVVSAVTDAEGRFQIDGAAPTEWVDVAAWHSDYSIGYLIDFDASRGDEAVFRLTQGGRVEGVVRRDGEPIANLRMWMGNSFGRPYEHGDGPPESSAFLALAGTDGSGHYLFERLPAGRYQVRVMDADPNTPLPLRYLQRRWVDVEDGETVTVDFNIETGSNVTGNVVGVTDFASVQLRLYDARYPEQVLYSTEERHDSSRPDAGGFFRFPPVPEGEYIVHGTVPGSTPLEAFAQCAVADGETAEVVLEFVQATPEAE